jgi:hypothetical protein
MKTCLLCLKGLRNLKNNNFQHNKALSEPFIILTDNSQVFKDKTTFQDINGLLMTNFTPEDLLLYLYKETSAAQTAAIEKALKKDWTLREKLAVLKTSMQRLDKIKENPRTEVVLNVLNYARKKSIEKVK